MIEREQKKKHKDKQREERLQIKNNFRTGAGNPFFSNGIEKKNPQNTENSVKFQMAFDKSAMDLNSKTNQNTLYKTGLQNDTPKSLERHTNNHLSCP